MNGLRSLSAHFLTGSLLAATLVSVPFATAAVVSDGASAERTSNATPTAYKGNQRKAKHKKAKHKKVKHKSKAYRKMKMRTTTTVVVNGASFTAAPGAPISVTGEVKSFDVTRVVSAQHKVNGQWVWVYTTRSNDKGRFTLKLTAPKSGSTTFRVKVPSSSKGAQLGYSNAFTVTAKKGNTPQPPPPETKVESQVALTAPSGVVTTGEVATLTGKVAPMSSGRTASLEKTAGNGWSTVKEVPLNADGSFGVNVDTQVAGALSYRVSAPASGRYLPATSSPVTVTVEAPAPPQTETPFLFGAAHGGNTEPTALEAASGAPLGMRRTYFQATGLAKAVSTADADFTKGRVPFVSFKLPGTWTEMNTGAHDAWAKDVATKLAAVGVKHNSEVWVVLHHEPENDEPDITQWTKMQQRLAPYFDREGIRFGICVTGWNQFYSGREQFKFENMYPYGAPIDFIALDIYQSYGEPKNPTKWSDLNGYWTKMGAFAKTVDVDWGLGEFGITNEGFADPRGKSFFTDTVDGMKANGGSFAAYFDSDLNTGGASYALTGAKLAAWASAAKSLHVAR